MIQAITMASLLPSEGELLSNCPERGFFSWCRARLDGLAVHGQYLLSDDVIAGFLPGEI